MTTPRSLKVTLVALTVGLTLIAAGAVAAFTFYLLGGDAAAPGDRHSAVTVQLLGAIGSVISAAILGVLTWILIVHTREMSVATEQLARITRQQFEESGPTAQIIASKFQPVVDPSDYDNPDDPQTPPEPELRVHVRNVGGRPLVVKSLVIESDWLQPTYDSEGDFESMETYTTEEEFPIEKAELLEGVAGQIPPGADAHWSKPNHGFSIEPDLHGLRIGVRLQDGTTVWSPRAAIK